MSNRPLFSIIVPTYSRVRQLTECLEALALIEYPRDRFEVVVVDDGGPESLNALTDRLASRLPLTLHRQDNRGPAAARNAGATIARGEYLVFTDDDCRPAPRWLTALAEAARAHPGAIIGGQIVNTLMRNSFAIASQCLISFLYSYYNHHPSGARFFTSNNLAVPTGRFRRLGGFDERFRMAAGEDRDFCDRWHSMDWPMVYADGAVVHHAHDLTFPRFLRQHLNYGRAAYHFHQRRAERAKRMWFEPLEFYAGLLRHPWSERLGWRTLSVGPLMAVTQVANAVGFFLEKLGTRT